MSLEQEQLDARLDKLFKLDEAKKDKARLKKIEDTKIAE